MAATPKPDLAFEHACPDCGRRTVELPGPLPTPGDDFDWTARDFDGFRRFMLEELAARFPDRRRWTPADLEVVIVEALAALLDQLSDMADRVFAEAYLETARRPDSVRRLLAMIGYDAVAVARSLGQIGPDDLRVFIAGEPSAGAMVMEFVATRGLGLPDDFAGSQLTARTAATSEVVFDVQKNGSNIGTITVAASSTTGSFATFGAVSLVAGDRLAIVAEDPADATLADVTITLKTTIDAPSVALLESFWADHPYEMERARAAGPLVVRTQHRMVTVEDYAARLEDHPLVSRAVAWADWTGAWSTINVAVILWDTKLELDARVPGPADPGSDADKQRLDRLRRDIERFHRERRLQDPVWESEPMARTVLRPYLDAYRMAGQEVLLRDALPVGITILVSLVVDPNYFQSEVRTAAGHALGSEPGGFFEPGRLRFGEDLFASDLIAMLMALDGVRNVCLIRFKRTGVRNPDQSDSGRIVLEGLELAVCDNDPDHPERGYFTIRTHGGRAG